MHLCKASLHYPCVSSDSTSFYAFCKVEYQCMCIVYYASEYCEHKQNYYRSNHKSNNYNCQLYHIVVRILHNSNSLELLAICNHYNLAVKTKHTVFYISESHFNPWQLPWVFFSLPLSIIIISYLHSHHRPDPRLSHHPHLLLPLHFTWPPSHHQYLLLALHHLSHHRPSHHNLPLPSPTSPTHTPSHHCSLSYQSHLLLTLP